MGEEVSHSVRGERRKKERKNERRKGEHAHARDLRDGSHGTRSDSAGGSHLANSSNDCRRAVAAAAVAAADAVNANPTKDFDRRSSTTHTTYGSREGRPGREILSP